MTANVDPIHASALARVSPYPNPPPSPEFLLSGNTKMLCSREADKRAHEAKQAARLNEVAVNKSMQPSNTSDVPIWKQNQIQKKRRRQRRLVEQHQAHGPSIGGHGGALPQIVPVNGTAIHGPTGFTTSSKPPFPSSTLPKVPLHHSHQHGATLLPGILKPNLLSTKHLPKHKIKPNDVTTKSVYSHYQLPSISRHVYH